MATGAQIPVNIINRLARLEQFMKKLLLYQDVSFYDHIQSSTIVTSLKKKRKVIPVLKENQQVLGLFVEKYHEKHAAFKHGSTTFPLAIFTTEGKLH